MSPSPRSRISPSFLTRPIFRRAKTWALLAALALGGAVGWAASPAKLAAREPIAPINVQDGVAAKGYDVVAYFTDGKPVPGSPAHAYKWQGVTYRFASDGHRDAFKRQPEKYAPQYGGY